MCMKYSMLDHFLHAFCKQRVHLMLASDLL